VELGGTHLCAALVDTERNQLVKESRREARLDSTASAEVLLDQIASSVNALNAPEGGALALAMPGPFDYERGIGRFKGIGKFESLDGVNVARELEQRLTTPSRHIVFLNDAEAFLLGEWASGTLVGHERGVAITIGTGVGSAFVLNGELVREGFGVPLDGAVHNLRFRGAALEDVVSRRCIREAYCTLRPGNGSLDVIDIAQRARAGDIAARQVFVDIFSALGEALASTLKSFSNTTLVIGGGISQTWELVEPPLRSALLSNGVNAALHIQRATNPNESALVGAAIYAVQKSRFAPTSEHGAIEG
jgi:glucokinase